MARELELLDELRDVLWVVEDWTSATRGRGSTLEGPAKLDDQKVFYWRLNRQLEVSPWEIDVLLDMDETYLTEALTPLDDEKGTGNG